MSWGVTVRMKCLAAAPHGRVRFGPICTKTDGWKDIRSYGNKTLKVGGLQPGKWCNGSTPHLAGGLGSNPFFSTTSGKQMQREIKVSSERGRFPRI